MKIIFIGIFIFGLLAAALAAVWVLAVVLSWVFREVDRNPNGGADSDWPEGYDD